jgi:hypothetical protein
VFLSELLYEFAHSTDSTTAIYRIYVSAQPCLLHLSLYAPNF